MASIPSSCSWDVFNKSWAVSRSCQMIELSSEFHYTMEETSNSFFWSQSCHVPIYSYTYIFTVWSRRPYLSSSCIYNALGMDDQLGRWEHMAGVQMWFQLPDSPSFPRSNCKAQVQIVSPKARHATVSQRKPWYHFCYPPIPAFTTAVNYPAPASVKPPIPLIQTHEQWCIAGTEISEPCIHYVIVIITFWGPYIYS